MLSEIKCGLSALGALMFLRAPLALRVASASRAQGGERLSRSGWRAPLALRMASASRAQDGERLSRSGSIIVSFFCYWRCQKCDYLLFCSQSTTLLRLDLTDCSHNGCTHKVRPPRPRNDSTQARLLRFGHPKGFYSVARLSHSLWH